MDTHVMHGYDMKAISHLARVTVLNNRHRMADLNIDEAINDAWEGVVERLLASEEPPTSRDLMDAGFAAAARDQRQFMQMTGVPVNENGTGKMFARYWQQVERMPPPDSVCDVIAFRQIWPLLSDTDRQVLKVHALADHSPARGAEMLGISKRAYEGKLSRARQKFAKWWHEHETPRAIKPQGIRRPGAGFAARGAV